MTSMPPSPLATLAAAPAAQATPARHAQPESGGRGEGFSQALEQAQTPKEQAPAPGAGDGNGSLRLAPHLAPRASAETQQDPRQLAKALKPKALAEVDAESTLPLPLPLPEPEPDRAGSEVATANPADVAALLAQWRAAPAANDAAPASSSAAAARLLTSGATAPLTDESPAGIAADVAAWSALAASKAAAAGHPDSRAVDGATQVLPGAAGQAALASDKAASAAALAAAVANKPLTSAANAETAAPPAAAPLPAWAPVATAPAALPAAAQALLPASPGSAQFAAQFSAQITTFVRHGIENARLHLNPAEMGPVSVRIQIDGSQALIHLGAEQALTRQALEQAMPLLASSLREAGLTLAGGGVFEQARQGQNPDAQRPRDGQAAHRSGSAQGHTSRDAEAPAPQAQARSRGVVDLVA